MSFIFGPASPTVPMPTALNGEQPLPDNGVSRSSLSLAGSGRRLLLLLDLPGHRSGLLDEEALRVDGKRHPDLPARVRALHDLQCAPNALGLHSYSVSDSSPAYFHRDSYHSTSPSLPKPCPLLSLTALLLHHQCTLFLKTMQQYKRYFPNTPTDP